MQLINQWKVVVNRRRQNRRRRSVDEIELGWTTEYVKARSPAQAISFDVTTADRVRRSSSVEFTNVWATSDSSYMILIIS